MPEVRGPLSGTADPGVLTTHLPPGLDHLFSGSKTPLTFSRPTLVAATGEWLWGKLRTSVHGAVASHRPEHLGAESTESLVYGLQR